MVKRIIISLFLAVLMLNFVAAWGLDITKINDGAIISDYDSPVERMSFMISGISCNNITDVWYTLDGGITNASKACSESETVLTNLVDQEGNNSWTVYAKDRENITKSATVNFWVDSIYPVINVTNINYPLHYTNQRSFSIVASLTETNPYKYGLGNYIMQFRHWWNGDDDSYSQENKPLGSLSFNAPSSGTFDMDGERNYSLWAKDTIGHETKIYGLVIIDTVLPSISITAPENGANLTGAISISTSASDERSGLASILINASQGILSNSTSCSSSPCNFNWNSAEFNDGQVNITATSTDRAGNSNSTTITIEIDNTFPQITFNSPENGTYNESQIINISASDAHLANITLYIDGETANITSLSEIIYLMNAGNSVYAIACDTFGNCNASETRSIIIDTIPPVLTLLGDNPQYIELGSDYTELGATAQDAISGNLTRNIVTDSSAVNTSALGTYYVYYIVQDNATNSATVNRTIIVNDTRAPELNEITGPENNQPYGPGTSLNFTINTTDSGNIEGCYLTLNSEDNLMESGYGGFRITLPSEGSFAPGEYFWNITCTDASGNSNTTNTLTFTILPELGNSDNFDDYTNLSNEDDISNVLYFFVSNEFGIINWTEAIDFSRGFDWSLFINISENFIDVNTTGLPEFAGKDAVITLYNLTWTTPRILRNGAVCNSPDCTVLNYTNGTLIFSITGFSNYTTEETPIESSSSGGGGGSGSCKTNWTCTSWSLCIDGIQTRTCSKIAENCIPLSDKPSESQFCTISSEEKNDTEPIVPLSTSSEEPKQQESNTESQGFFSITGAFIGGNAVPLTAGFIFIFLVILGYVFIKRKRNALIESKLQSELVRVNSMPR